MVDDEHDNAPDDVAAGDIQLTRLSARQIRSGDVNEL